MSELKNYWFATALLVISSCSYSERDETTGRSQTGQAKLNERLVSEVSIPSARITLETRAYSPQKNDFLPKTKRLPSSFCNQNRDCYASVFFERAVVSNTRTIDNSEDQSSRSPTTIEQNSNYPHQDIDLVQLPNESSFQAVNSIYTSEIDDNSKLIQSAEYKNVKFNQLSSPSSLHTINATVTDDKSISGSLDQKFKFKNIEMIQRDSTGSIHSINYIGDR